MMIARMCLVVCTTAALAFAAGAPVPDEGPADGVVKGWFEVTPNPCVAWCSYDIYYKVWNGTPSPITVTRITDNGSDAWTGSMTVPGCEAKTIKTGHGDHATTGSYDHRAVFYTSGGTAYDTTYTFLVEASGLCGWIDVVPNPCEAWDPYDVYFKLYNGTGSSVNVTRVTDNGSDVWTGSTTVSPSELCVVHSGHGDHASSGVWVHNPVFYTSGGNVQGSRYEFLVNTLPGVAEQWPGAEPHSCRLVCVPSVLQTGTAVSFFKDHAGPTVVDVLDASGRVVATLLDEMLDCGEHHVRWQGFDADGRRVSPGVYFCRLATDGRQATRRLSVVD